jgi:pilus assembly protein CpaF
MPVVGSVKRTADKKDISIAHGTLKHNDIYNEILHDLIYTKASLINAVQSGFLTDSKETKASKEALVGEINRLCKEKAKRYSFDENEMSRRVMNFLLGYGILEDLVTDDEISDIDFTRYDHCTIKRNGVKEISSIRFDSDEEFKNFATLMIVRNGGIINADENHRRESDERYRLRINVAIPPRNVTGTSLIMRKHRMNPYSIQDLVELEMLSEPVAKYLRDSFKEGKRNTLFVGKGASGKTTLLRACLMEVDPLRNFLICEKDTELYLNQYPNFIIQRIKKSGDGGRAVTLKDLVSDGLTMSVEGMVVGELVGDEVYDFLSAGYTDHVIYGTAHTSGVYDTAKRLLTMIETGTRRLSEGVIKEIIAGSIQDIVYLDGFKVKDIKRITGYNKANDTFEYKDVKGLVERGEDVG